jgi:hypothetical protein
MLSVAIKGSQGHSTLILRYERGEHRIQVGYGTWLKDTTDIRGRGEEPVASGAWTAEDIYEIRVCYYHSQFCPVFRFRYLPGDLQMEVEPNVSRDPPTVTKITGRVAGRAA